MQTSIMKQLFGNVGLSCKYFLNPQKNYSMKKILFATAIILTTTASTCFGPSSGHRFQWGKAEPVKPPVELATIPAT